MKKRVAIVYGGPSSEHEVSVNSAKNIRKCLERARYDIIPVKVGKNGKWRTPQGVFDEQAAIRALRDDIDLVFNIIHGTYGEDGYLQDLLESAGIPFTGSGSEASRLGMDKIKSFELFRRSGLLVAKYLVVRRGAEGSIVPEELAYPVVVKPYDNGSSVGVYIVESARDLRPAVLATHSYSEVAIIQAYIKGRELTCGVIEIKGVPVALAPTEIIPNSGDFFDYDSKYVKGASTEITPANLPKAILAKIQAQAVMAHEAVGCEGISRTDFILDEKGDLYVLEINTIPGMTETSLIPQGAAAVGINIVELLNHIIDSAR